MNGNVITQNEFKRQEQRFDIKYYLSTNFLGYPEEIKLRYKAYWRKEKDPDTKFLIFSSGRSGSTLLLDLIQKHPEVYCDSEILKRRLLNPKKLIQARAKLSKTSIYGFKLLSYQLRDVQKGIKNNKVFIEELVEDGFKIIYLNRQNKFLQALSLFKAISQAKWHTTKTNKSPASKLEVDPKKLTNLIEDLKELEAFEQYILAGIPHLPVIYEKDLSNELAQGLTMTRVCEMLNIQHHPVKSKLKKINPTKPSLLISNWEEVQKHLENSSARNFLAKLATG